MAAAEDVLGVVLAGADQVAHDLLLGRWHADRGELARAEEPAEHPRIAAVGLHALAGPLGDERGGDDRAVDAERAELAFKLVPGGSRLIADPQPRRIAPAAHLRAYRLGGVRDGVLERHVLVLAQQRDRDGVLRDVHPNEGHGATLGHGRRPPSASSGPA